MSGRREILSENGANALKTIVVTAATSREISVLVGGTGAVAKMFRGIPRFYEKTLPDKRIIIAETGMGKVNTALSTASLVCAYNPVLLVNTGCAGAYAESGLSVGDLAVACKEIYGDEGVQTLSGWRPLDYIGIPLVEIEGIRYFNEIPLAFAPAEKALRFAEMHGIGVMKGRFVTVSTCSGTSARGAELASRFDAICENMEGAAVAHVALCYGVECLEIRGISNMVEDRDLSRWDFGKATENVQRFILAFLNSF
jgi:futalosine hydrolase